MIKMHLSRILGDRKMSQADLARLTGIRPNMINSMFHGTAKYIRLEQLDRICEVLNCELDELVERVPKPK